MEIQEFKQRWNGQPIELISTEEACVLVNLQRELEERASYVAQKAETIGWQASKVVPVANGWAERTRNLMFVGDDVAGKSVTTTTEVRSFGEFRRDFENMICMLQTRVEASDYVMGAIRSLGFDVRPDTTVEKVSSVTMAAAKRALAWSWCRRSLIRQRRCTFRCTRRTVTFDLWPWPEPGGTR